MIVARLLLAALGAGAAILLFRRIAPYVERVVTLSDAVVIALPSLLPAIPSERLCLLIYVGLALAVTLWDPCQRRKERV